MTEKGFRDYFVSGDLHLASLGLGLGDRCLLLYLSGNSVHLSPYIYQLKITSILKIYCNDPYFVSEGDRILFMRPPGKIEFNTGDEWLKERILQQEIPWGLSQRLIESYRKILSVEDRYALKYKCPISLAYDVVSLWADTLRIGNGKLLITSDKEIDILEDFRDIAKEMLIMLMLKGDDRVCGIYIDEPDYSFL